ncbi:MAG: nucleotidyltransferase domain-containing protein [Chitinivibrionia bacterium]|nr:nucleotidyltransferase domain-containing protein [Chitinivibrionia bacterium]
MLNTSKEEEEELFEIIGRLASNCDVLAFGSRVAGTNRKYSDLDLAFILPDNEKMAAKQWSKLKYAFELSDLQFRVDIVDYNGCEDYFKKIIDGNNLKIYSRKT